MMKKFISLVCVVFILFSVCTCYAFATDETITDIEYYDDGSYTVTMVMHTYSLLATSNTVTRTTECKHYDSNNNLDWKAAITATFTYNGTTASCTSVSKSHTIYDSSWKLTSSNTSKTGATATGNFTFKHYVLSIPNKTVNKTLTLTCDKNGNVS